MDGLVGEGLLRGLASRADSTAWVDLWRAISFLGHPTFFTIAIPALFAWMPWSLARRFSAGLLMAIYVSETLKHAIGRSRPDVTELGLSTPLELPGRFESAALPSGHTLIATVVWGIVAVWASRRHPRARVPIFAAAALLVVAIGFSRLALLRHDLLDVGTGLLIGAVLLAVFILIDRLWIPRLRRLPWEEQAGLWLLTAVAAQWMSAIHVTAIVLGMLVGLQAGASFIQAWGRETKAKWQGPVRFAVMLAGAVAVRWISQRWLPENEIFLLVVFGLGGLWIAGLAPRGLGGAVPDTVASPPHRNSGEA